MCRRARAWAASLNDRKVEMKYSVKNLRDRQNKIRYNWGYQFALWCALLWGTCYESLGLLLSRDSFLPAGPGARDPYALGTALAVILTVMIAVISVVWVSCTSGFGEVRKTLLTSKRVTLYYVVTAAVGGVAAWSTYVTAGLLDTLFAVACVIFYPVVGMVLSQSWLREKISGKAKAGMAVILLGWLVLYAPAILGGAPSAGYLLGVLTGIGWGIEGAFAGRALEVTDAASGVAVRFCIETAMWAVLLIVLAVFRPSGTTLAYIGAILRSPFSMLMLFTIALCLTFNYIAWYRAFSLVGVFNGLVVSDVSGFVVVAVTMLLGMAMPKWPEIIAALLMLFGVFIVYYGGNRGAAVLRDVSLTPRAERGPARPGADALHLKGQALLLVEQGGPIWDFEVADALSEGMAGGRRRAHCRDVVRTSLIEARAVGLLVSVEEAVDDGERFKKGKLLSRYQITEYGYNRLVGSGLLRAAPGGAEGQG